MSTRSSPELDHYLELVRKFPLRPLRTDEDLDQAIKIIDSLILRGDLDSGEQDYLDMVTDIVEKYETEAHPMPPLSDADMLRHLLEARGITQSQLAADVGIPNSTISEVLASKRSMTRHHLSVISKYFHVSPMVFNI